MTKIYKGVDDEGNEFFTTDRSLPGVKTDDDESDTVPGESSATDPNAIAESAEENSGRDRRRSAK